MTLRDPIVDDKYRVVAELGRGGMGIVYEAVHLGLGHKVAIKFLFESGVKSDSMLARFAREARALPADQCPGNGFPIARRCTLTFPPNPSSRPRRWARASPARL